MATGSLALLPHDLKPKEPIEDQGHYHHVGEQMLLLSSGYKPSLVPSDSAWAICGGDSTRFPRVDSPRADSAK